MIYSQTQSFKLLLCISFSLVLSFWADGQEELPKKNTKHHFLLGYHTGWNSINFTSTSGNEELRNTIGRNRTLRLGYRYWLSNRFHLESGLGFGFQTERSQIPLAGYGYFPNGVESTQHFAFSRLDLQMAYQFYANNKHAFYVLGGGGANYFFPIGSGFGYGSETDLFVVQYKVDEQLTPFLNLGASYQFETKRQDILGIKMYYNYGWESFFSGRYSLERNNESSTGKIESMLQGVHLGLEYTFTRNNKKSKLVAYQKDSIMDRKSAKKQLKFDKRAIDAKSRFISLCIGGATTINKFDPNNGAFSSPPGGSLLGKITYEHGWKNNIFFEVDYNGFYLSEGGAFISSNGENTTNVGWSSDILFAHFLSGGLNYKIQRKKTNFQFFNVHAGVGLGAHFNARGDQDTGYGSIGTLNQYSIDYTFNSVVTGALMPILYTGISKDIRITEKIQLSLAYRYQLGFNTVYRTDYSISINSAPPELQVGNIDGTAFLFSFGLKYRLK